MAHCLDDSISTQVILGAHALKATEPTQQRLTVYPENYRIHPLYDMQTLAGDIGILILPQAVTLNQFVAVVALPALGVTETFAGITATTTGWGKVSEESTELSYFLRSVQNVILENVECKASFGGWEGITESIVCKSTEDFRGICKYFIAQISLL